MFESFLKKLPKDLSVQVKKTSDDIDILPDSLRNFIETL
jgi:hypothetical protein